jgi:aldose 1-epimerase
MLIKIEMNNTLLVLILFAFAGCNFIQDKKNEQKTEIQVNIKKEIFGQVGNDTVYLYTFSNKNGVKVKITNYGGIVTSILVPDRNGNYDDVVLGYDHLQGYLNETPYFGCIVGRYANRIAKGKFTLDGDEYSLAINNGENSLHGGLVGFDKVVWDAEEFWDEGIVGLNLNYISNDGDEGYPGNLWVLVTYTLTDKNEFKIEYRASTDKATPLNLTHHSYFNLCGTNGKDILGHILRIDANKYVVVDETLIPTGELRDLTGSPMDFRTATSIGSRIDNVVGGYDHTYVLNNQSLSLIAELFEPESGRLMEVYTTEPGVQLYTGNFLDGSLTGKQGIVYNIHTGLCLETQHFPDSPNQPGFPSTILRPGEEYTQTTIYKFGVK